MKLRHIVFILLFVCVLCKKNITGNFICINVHECDKKNYVIRSIPLRFHTRCYTKLINNINFKSLYNLKSLER